MQELRGLLLASLPPSAPRSGGGGQSLGRFAEELSQPQSVYPAASFYSDFPLLRALCRRVELEWHVAVRGSG